jgi:Fe-S cluster assembly iron-binding protein IscA
MCTLEDLADTRVQGTLSFFSYWGGIMLTVTEKAALHLHEIAGVQTNGNTAIRVAVMGSGSGSGLGLVVDQITGDDLVSAHGSHTVVVDRQLLAYCRQITIDFVEGEPNGCASRSGRGFLLHAEQPIAL